MTESKTSASLVLVWLFLAASIGVLVYTFYRAEVVWQGDKETAYNLYYLASIFSIVFWFIVSRLRQSIRVNAIITTLSLVVGLYLMEGLLMLLDKGSSHNRANARAAEMLGLPYDKRTKGEVLEDLISEGVDAVPTVAQSDMDSEIEDLGGLFPLAGVSYKETVYTNETGKYLIYKSDRHGFHNPDSVWDKKEVAGILIGDSFVHGASVQPGEEISAQLRVKTKKTVVNLGMGGNGPLQMYATIVEYGKYLKPAQVLWFYYEDNDLKANIIREKNNPKLTQYLEHNATQNLYYRQQEIDERLFTFIAEKRGEAARRAQLHRTGWIRLYGVRQLLGLVVGNELDSISVVNLDPVFSEVLSKSKAEVESWGGEFLFVYLPTYTRYSKDGISHDEYRKKGEVINIVNQLGIPVIDVHEEVFMIEEDPLKLFPFGLYGHYNAVGYERIASAVAKRM